MKDPVFHGRDVADALRLAARTLGLPATELRYVILDPGSPGGRGLSATEARIAILLDARARSAAESPFTGRAAAGAEGHDDQEGDQPGTNAGDVRDDIAAILSRFGESMGGGELTCSFEATRDALDVRVGGPGIAALLDDEGEALAALEHVLDHAFGRRLTGHRVRVQCEGYRERRDEVLKRRARELAERVRASGQPHVTAPLNAYERRIIHMTAGEEEGLATFSTGDGREKRVTIALRNEVGQESGGQGAASPEETPQAENGKAADAESAREPESVSAPDAPVQPGVSRSTPPEPQRFLDPFPSPPTERGELM